MAPGAYRRGGEGIAIAFTTIRTPLGWLLVATTEKGVCAVRLGDSRHALVAELRAEFPAADISANDTVPDAWMTEIVHRLSGSSPAADVPLDVRGTSFQWRVWQALQKIPSGHTRSYADIARAIGQPAAVRAVARACATNPVGVIIPCHRVTPRRGGLGGYRWGVERKAKLLKRERQAARKPQ
jgi:AraC family transcriptional regulator of adaptative response/methylated-DNA-[protein]-cysteine methyltransferase